MSLDLTPVHRNLHTKVTFLGLEFEDLILVLALAAVMKDVHHLSNGTETTDHFVNECRIRLIPDRRSDVNPDGLWIAEYSERPIDGERRDQILAAPNQDRAPGNGGQQ